MSMNAPQNAIHLYRRCLRSISLIRDHSQRATFLEYTRDGFKRRRHLHPDSREAHLAYNDALEQVKSMEYYQQMQTMKLNNENNSNHLLNNIPRGTSSTHESSSIEAAQLSQNTKVAQWLLSQLPHMHQDDASKYATQLFHLGFDSVAFVEEELIEDDLSFMKTAHKRVLIRQLSKIREEKNFE